MALSGKLRRGTRFVLGFLSDVYDLETTDFTLVAHGPEGTDPLTWKWRPGSPGDSDDELTWDAVNSRLVFFLTSTQTATTFAVGSWRLYFLVDDPTTVQDELTEYSLTVRDGKAGVPMPVV